MDTLNNYLITNGSCDVELVQFIQGVMALFPASKQVEVLSQLRSCNEVDMKSDSRKRAELSSETLQTDTIDFYSSNFLQLNVQQINTISPSTGGSPACSILTPLPLSLTDSNTEIPHDNLLESHMEYSTEYNKERELLLSEAKEKAKLMQRQWEKEKKSLKLIIKESLLEDKQNIELFEIAEAIRLQFEAEHNKYIRKLQDMQMIDSHAHKRMKTYEDDFDVDELHAYYKKQLTDKDQMYTQLLKQQCGYNSNASKASSFNINLCLPGVESMNNANRNTNSMIEIGSSNTSKFDYNYEETPTNLISEFDAEANLILNNQKAKSAKKLKPFLTPVAQS